MKHFITIKKLIRSDLQKTIDYIKGGNKESGEGVGEKALQKIRRALEEGFDADGKINVSQSSKALTFSKVENTGDNIDAMLGRFRL